jgi:hypothetical protein
MKVINTLLVGSALLVSAPSLAGTCDGLFGRVNGWLAGTNHFVRIVTTFTKADDKVQYTRGYLSEDADIAGRLTAPSVRYTNDSNPAFSDAGSDHVTITVFPTSADSAQINYQIDSDASSVGYSALCTADMLYALPAAGGVLAASFRFSGAR